MPKKKLLNISCIPHTTKISTGIVSLNISSGIRFPYPVSDQITNDMMAPMIPISRRINPIKIPLFIVNFISFLSNPVIGIKLVLAAYFFVRIKNSIS